MEGISPKQRAVLKAEGNTLKPVVLIGKEGIDNRVIKSLEEYFQKHTLAKVKLLKSCSLNREKISSQLSEITGAFQIQQIGKTILLYRKPEDDLARPN